MTETIIQLSVGFVLLILIIIAFIYDHKDKNDHTGIRTVYAKDD